MSSCQCFVSVLNVFFFLLFRPVPLQSCVDDYVVCMWCVCSRVLLCLCPMSLSSRVDVYLCSMSCVTSQFVFVVGVSALFCYNTRLVRYSC